MKSIVESIMNERWSDAARDEMFDTLPIEKHHKVLAIRVGGQMDYCKALTLEEVEDYLEVVQLEDAFEDIRKMAVGDEQVWDDPSNGKNAKVYFIRFRR